MTITIKTVCEDGTESYLNNDYIGVDVGSWSELTSTITLPACALTEVSLYFENAAPAYDIYLDDVSVIAVE